MEPTTTPPWRVLDAPAATGSAQAADPERPAQILLSPTIVKVAATAAGAVVCGIVAFVVAFAGGPSGAVVLDGGSPLPIARSSADGVAPVGAIDPGTGAEVVVEIVGAVPRPGVFRLPAGSRVGDLIAAAGGYGPRVDTALAERDLNLAATLRDGDHVRVPSRDDASVGRTAGPGGDSGAQGGTIDLNRATQAELEALPGIGPATALKIIAAREEAPFAAVDELRSRGIMGEKTFEKVRELVAVR